MERTPVIEVRGISKSFTSTKALQDVSLAVYGGEVHGLIGENGSGKSTLSAIISGNLKADAGEMFLFGKPYKPADSFDASMQGVSMIVQEQGTIDTISVAANICAGRENQYCKFGILNAAKLSADADKLLKQIGVDDISTSTLAGALSFEDRKLVEIARAFYKTPELFIVDETTTALPQKGRNILYKLIASLNDLKKLGFFITPGSEKKLAGEWCGKLSVKMRDQEQSCAELSGGNKQKIVLAKWLGNNSDVFILDCPTRGIDIGVKETIYRIMEDLKRQGKSIIMISEELPEVIGMSDRILVMKDGQIVNEFTRNASLTEADVIQHMI